MTTATSTIPGYVVGTWDIDPVHSEVSFVIRHMAVSKVRGRFDRFEGSLSLTEDPFNSSVEAVIEAASVNTGNEQRDDHVRSADFFDVEHHPQISFHSTAVRPKGDRFVLEGDLSIRGTTRPVKLDLEVNGFGPDPWGGTRVGYSASTEINRDDFGVSYNGPIPGAGNGMILSNKVVINLEIEAVLRSDS